MIRISILSLLTALVAFGCGPNEGVLRDGKQTPAPPGVDEQKKDEFETDLAEIKGTKFTWLYVVRRRDGGILNSEDKAFVKQHTTDANSRSLTDGGKAIIIGSDYSNVSTTIENLKKRFDVTDMSPTPAPQ